MGVVTVRVKVKGGKVVCTPDFKIDASDDVRTSNATKDLYETIVEGFKAAQGGSFRSLVAEVKP